MQIPYPVSSFLRSGALCGSVMEEDELGMVPVSRAMAQSVLRYGLAITVGAAGVHGLFIDQTVWSSYLALPIVKMLPVSVPVFMMAVEFFEIIAAVMLLVSQTALYGAVISVILLVGITVNVILGGTAFDIIIRDIGLVGYAVGTLLVLGATDNH